MPPLIPLDWSRYRRKDEVVAREVEALAPYPFTSIQIPGLSDEEYALLLDSVRAEGVRPTDPLTVTPDGLVVDGQARLRAAKQAGVPTVPTRVLEAPGEADYAVWAARENLTRRHLSTEQRFALVQAALAILESRARVSQRATQFRPKARTSMQGTRTEPESVSPRHIENPIGVVKSDYTANSTTLAGARGTRARAAQLLDVSPSQAAKMIKIAKHGSPELREAVTSGRMSVHQAHETLKTQRPGANGRPRRPAPAPVLGSDQPVKTLNTVAAWIPEWLEELPNWPPERQEHWWKALQNVTDSCALAFRRREQL